MRYPEQSDRGSARDSKKRHKSKKVKMKDGTVIDLTPPEELLERAEGRAKFLETKNKVRSF